VFVQIITAHAGTKMMLMLEADPDIVRQVVGLLQACLNCALWLARRADPTGGQRLARHDSSRYTCLASPPLHTHVKTARFGTPSWRAADIDSMLAI